MDSLISSGVTYAIIGITILLSYRAFNDQSLNYRWLYNPYQVHHRGQWYRMISHAFIHGDYMHLGFNMLALYFFGSSCEATLSVIFGLGVGKLLFAVLYVGGILFASLPAYGKHKDNPHYNSLGASGAVAATMFASAILYPDRGIYLMFIPIPIPAYVFAPLYLALEAYLSKRGGTGIAHDAHFWGALFGLLFILLVQPEAYVRFFQYIAYAIG